MLNFIRDKDGPKLSAMQLKYLNDGKDEHQYYDHKASSGVESMNQANKKAQERAAVDVVNAVMLLLEMERYILVFAQ